MTEPDTESNYTLFRRGLPRRHAAIVAGTLVLGMTLMDYRTEALSGNADIAPFIAAALISPAIGYAAIERRWKLTLVNVFAYIYVYLTAV